MLTAVRWVFFAAFLVTIGWVAYLPGFDSAAACVAALAAFVASFFLKAEEKPNEQVQTISGASIGIQAGGDVKIRDIKSK